MTCILPNVPIVVLASIHSQRLKVSNKAVDRSDASVLGSRKMTTQPAAASHIITLPTEVQKLHNSIVYVI